MIEAAQMLSCGPSLETLRSSLSYLNDLTLQVI